jgi:hypothetical protein
MTRWLLLAVFSMLPVFGCASSQVGPVGVSAGLANAPRLGGTPTADNRISDVIANGNDACGVTGGEAGPLPNRIPPCVPSGAWVPGRPLAAVVSPPTPSSELVEPWLNHFYVGWPCPHASRQTKSLLPAGVAVAECTVPLER